MAIPTNRESDKFVLRLPDGMRDRIKAAADANSRSMNAEIVARLSATLADPRFERIPDTVVDLVKRLERLEQIIEEK